MAELKAVLSPELRVMADVEGIRATAAVPSLNWEVGRPERFTATEGSVRLGIGG
jgi:hypothetical protein